MIIFSTPLPLYVPVHNFDNSLSIPPVAYVLNGWPISQPKINNNIRISYSLKYKHSKKKKILQDPYPSKDITLDLSHVILRQ